MQEKNHFAYITNDINEIKDFNDLKKLGAAFNEIKSVDRHQFDNLFSEQFLKSKKLPQIVAICMIVPLHFAPEQLYNLITRILGDITHIPNEYKTTLVMRFVESALTIGRGTELFNTGIIQTFQKDSPKFFTVPLLFLSASICAPLEIATIQFNDSPMLDIMAYYYSACNLILLHKFPEAEDQLLRAYALSKCYKKMKPAIVSKLNLTSFLNQSSFNCLMKKISLKDKPDENVLLIWEIDPQLFKITDQFYLKLENEIRKEHTRRVIFDYAKSTVQLNINLLRKECQNFYFEETLTILKESGELKFRIRDDVIKFIRINYQLRADKEQMTVEKLNFLK
ncbi:hypothetical protein TRFO_06852 [Tritrichomonas foetus]|uniref:PCI domain-containing protein n=1 Tax=Tritrichomonas foetus TaxID=1144522 RepID=A0A1J4JWX4_9EUKA|nr:hypothetical protein TRFO_06852 [Tritrichomonas foetus]|eukprot:OHT03170.1 hypothetical protein TRFO_06852 [Tritrichomonas foetus]